MRRKTLTCTPRYKSKTLRCENVDNNAIPRRTLDIKMSQGTNEVYFPETNIRMGKAIVKSEAAIVKSGMIMTAFSSEGYHPATNNPTMSEPRQPSSSVCWISAMGLNQNLSLVMQWSRFTSVTRNRSLLVWTSTTTCRLSIGGMKFRSIVDCSSLLY